MSPELEVLSASPLMHGMGEEKLSSLLRTAERRIKKVRVTLYSHTAEPSPVEVS